MKYIISFSLLALIFILSVARSYLLFKETLLLEKNHVAFSRVIPNEPQRILILGDSTAVGTGANDSKDSTAGRLGTLYPDAEVVNISENGLKIEGLLKKLKDIKPEEHFNIILIQIGANDIIRFTSLKDIENGLEKVLERAESFKGKVIVLHSGDIGETKFFPFFVRPLLSMRSKQVREIYIREAKLHGAEYVDLIDSHIAKSLKNEPELYYASDLLHLTNEGYGLWFKEIQKHL